MALTTTSQIAVTSTHGCRRDLQELRDRGYGHRADDAANRWQAASSSSPGLYQHQHRNSATSLPGSWAAARPAATGPSGSKPGETVAGLAGEVAPQVAHPARPGHDRTSAAPSLTMEPKSEPKLQHGAASEAAKLAAGHEVHRASSGAWSCCHFVVLFPCSP